MPVQTQILTRRGTAASWTSTNPTLGAGEIGYETDTGNFKIGTGAAAWASLAYFNKDPLTTKGDLYTFSTTDARLAVGANGETLVADSSTSTGLRYQEPLNLNPVLNSGFDIWQRGTASTAIGSGTFLADRWQAARTGFAAGASQSRQATGDTTNLPNIQYCLRVQRDSGDTSTLALIMGQNMESVNSIPYAGKTITFSFYARKGANFSAASNVMSTYVASGTGTDQNLITAGTLTGINNTTTNHTLSATWQRFTVTKAIDSTATQLAFQFFYTPVGTAGANDYFEVTGVMINIGSAAYPFRRTTGTIQGELAACQRYYETSYNYTQGPGTNVGSPNPSDWAMSVVQVAVGATAGIQRSRTVPMKYGVDKRIIPTIRFWDGAGNLSKYTAADSNGGFLSNNNSLDAFGGAASLNNKNFSWQTIAASATHAYCAIFWEASAEL